MQVFGAGSASSAATLSGAAAGSENSASEFAGQISAAIQNSEASILGADSPWRLASTAAIDGYAIADIEALGDVEGFASDLTGTLLGAVGETAGSSASATEASQADKADALAAFTDNASGEAKPSTEGIPGLQLIQLTGLELSSLVESGQLQPLNIEGINPTPADNDLFVFAAGGSTAKGAPVHLIPVAQLEAFNAPLSGGDLSAKIAAAQHVISEVAGARITSNPDGSSLAQISPTATSVADSAALDTATQQASSQPTATAATTNAPALDAASLDAALKAAGNETLAQAANNQSASQNATTLAGKLSLTELADKEAEGHLVQQKAQAATHQKAQASNMQAKAQAMQSQAETPQSALAASQAAVAASTANAAGADKGATSKHSVPSLNTASGVSDTSRAKQTASPLASRRDQAAAAARINLPVSWSSEALAGLPENAVLPDAVAGGLSGLRGEPGFMQSMGLTNHKAATPLGNHVASQINLQISKAVKNGTSEFNMRLNPGELGHVRVKLSFNEAGRVSAQLFAERPETLELLQREARGIERAVEAGGNKLEQGGLSFDLDTDDGQSAGKAFADAALQDQLKEKIEAGQPGSEDLDADGTADDLTDLTLLEEILSRVSPDTGLDVRV